jgi:hypothetical protein
MFIVVEITVANGSQIETFEIDPAISVITFNDRIVQVQMGSIPGIGTNSTAGLRR